MKKISIEKLMRITQEQMREGEPSPDEMRYDLAEAEAMNMNVSDIINILLDGTEGLENMPDLEVREEWNMMFAEERIQEENEAMRQGEWNSDPHDHIEERERDYMLGQGEAEDE